MFRKALFALSVLFMARAATASNIVFTMTGSAQSLSTTLTNPYDGTTLTVSGSYNDNTGTYNGLATNFNTLLMTNAADFFLLDNGGVQTAFNINRVITGDGNDIVDFASSSFVLAGIIFFPGNQNQVIWGNAGDDTFNFSAGHDVFNGGPGTDTLVLGNFASYTITRTGPQSFTVTDGTNVVDISSIEIAQFADRTVDLTTFDVTPTAVPEPATLVLLASGVALTARRRRH